MSGFPNLMNKSAAFAGITFDAAHDWHFVVQIKRFHVPEWYSYWFSEWCFFQDQSSRGQHLTWCYLIA